MSVPGQHMGTLGLVRRLGGPVPVAAVAIAFLLGGCGGLGPRRIPADQIDYSNAIGEAAKQQVLLNVVKLRFSDLPSFVSASQVVAGYQLSGNASLAAQVSNFGNLSLQAGNQAAVTLGGTFSDNPTVTYTPLTGVEFADTLLAPLGPADIVGLVLAGVPIPLALGVGLHSLGDYHNEIWGTLPNAQADPQFIELVGLIDELTRGGWIALTTTAPADRKAKGRADEEAKGGRRPTYLLFRAGRPEPGLQAKVARVRELLRLDPKRNEFELIFGLGPSEDPEKIAFRTRSLIEILGDLAGAVDMPDAAVAEQRGGAIRLFAPEVKVRTSPEPPGAAFVVVRYQGDWYYIANDDLRSRQLFTLCMLLYSLAQSGKPLQLRY